MLYEIIGAAVVVLLAVIAFFSTYTVVGPNEAHVIVFMGRGRKIKSPIAANGVDGKTSYFYVPVLMKRYIMPLTNVKLDILNIPLNDLEMAPFICDVMTWLHIADPVKAAERLNFTEGDAFESLHKDLVGIVQAIARASAMKQEILDIMRDRATFSKGVSTEVDTVLSSWGVELVNLEVNDIRDEANSAVIQNYELQRKANIESLTRIAVSTRDREAVEAEQGNRQLAEVAKAAAEQVLGSKQIDRDTILGLKNQDKESQIAVAAAKTNTQKVAALRVTTVGEAQITKEAAIETAEGTAEAIRITGEKEAAVVTLRGNAEASAIQAKGLAEAAAKDAMAVALQKFNDAATVIEKIRAAVDIQTAFAQAYGKIAENAEIKVVTGGQGGNILGLPMNAETGANFGQMIEALGVDKITEMFKKATGVPTKGSDTTEE
jgi:flotillin